MRICELKQKEVINICTCRTLGCPVDVEFNCEKPDVVYRPCGSRTWQFLLLFLGSRK